MANRDTELQKAEEKPRLLEVTSHPNFEPSLKLVQLGVLIMTALALLAGFLTWLAGFSYWLYIPIGVLVFLGFAVGWYLLVLRPQNRRFKAEISALQEAKTAPALQENIDTTDLSALPVENEEANAIEAPEIEKEKIIKSLQLRYQESSRQSEEKNSANIEQLEEKHKAIIEQKEASIRELDFLRDRVRKQQDNISPHITIEKIEYFSHNFEENSHLNIVFALEVFNKSFFDIAFENTIDGVITFNGKPYLEEKRFFEPPPYIIAIEKGYLKIEQRLTKQEVEILQSVLQDVNERKLNFQDFVLTVKTTPRCPSILPQPLKFNLEFSFTKETFNL